MTEIRNNAGLIWSIAELLRGDYKQADYGKVILPLVVMRRLDQALEQTKADVVAEAKDLEYRGITNVEDVLRIKAGLQFFNRSELSFPQLLEDPGNIANNLRAYIDGYSRLAHEVFENFEFENQIEKLEKANLLYMVIGRTCDVDLHPDRVSNLEMGYLFEDLIRRFSEQSNETAGEHFTPREVVQLMGNLLLDGDEAALTEKGVIRTVFDCACGTGGMLTEVENHIHELNPNANVHLFGQELNPESYAICLADMLVKGQDASNIVLGNSLSNDGHQNASFHYCIANPPFGVDWSKVEGEIRSEHAEMGFEGRFGPGLPSKDDGQLLFLLHLISKMRDPDQGGSRIAIVHNGSPLFSGGAGSGPSEIRRWIIENDMLEAIVALPEQLFYNTGIYSYVWLVTNRKAPERQGKVQLIDARDMYVKMEKSLGKKRRKISLEQISAITNIHGDFSNSSHSIVLTNDELGYRTVVVDQPLRAVWEIGETTWIGVDQDNPIRKLDPEKRAALVDALTADEEARFEDLDECKAHLKDLATKSGIEKPTAALLKALAVRCQVRSQSAEPTRDKKGALTPDPTLRDSERIPLTEDVVKYIAREVSPYIPDAWVEDTEGKIGYEIPLVRLFFQPYELAPSADLQESLKRLSNEFSDLLSGVLE